MRKVLSRLLLMALCVLVWPSLVQALSDEEVQRLKELTPAQRETVIQMLKDDGSSAEDDAPWDDPQWETSPWEGRSPAPTNAPKDVDDGELDDRQSDDTEREADQRDDASAVTDADNGPDTEESDEDRQVELESAKTARPVELDRYGYDLFKGAPTTFAPATDIPVPVDYVIGPGDRIQVQLYGKENTRHNLLVTREGDVPFPGIGPVNVAGLHFEEMKNLLEERIAQHMIGEKAAITMGRLRSIRVFILGDVNRPGSYTVSALSTLTNALFVSGGVTSAGTLRDIQLKRSGKLVTRLDLYDLLLKGDTSGDVRLQPGDVIFVPPVGKTVGVDGEVRRPAIYELRKESTVGELLGFAGGLLPTAYGPATQLERINQRGGKTLVDLDITDRAKLEYKVRNGDVLRVYSVLARMEGIVTLSGHVERPGPYEWTQGMRLTDLITSLDSLKPKADLDYVLVRRELQPDQRIVALSASMREALASPASAQNIRLEPRDEVFVFELGKDRKKRIGDLLIELKAQSAATRPAQIVSVSGRVGAVGEYPLVRGMRISDLIRAGGGLAESAYTLGAELTRYEVVEGKYREIGHLKIDMAKVLAGDKSANLVLKPHDNLHVQGVPEWSQTATVEIRGEVRFPGTYQVARGEQLSNLLERAGGLTDFAFPEGAVFMRDALRAKEKKQLDMLAKRLETELASSALERATGDAKQETAMDIGQALISQLRSTEPVGRLVIDLPKLIATSRAGRRGDHDVTLKDGDKIYIPQLTQEVTVVGEVFHPTSHLYVKGLERQAYIGKSGGVTRKADAKHVYVVRANGGVIANGAALPDLGNAWFERTDEDGIKSGDTIVVPLDIDRIRPLTLWTNISQIVYQIGIAAAAANAIGVF